MLRSFWLATLGFTMLAHSGRAQQIWLAAVDPYTQSARHWQASLDYMQLFEANAPWQTVASHTSTFKIGPGFALSGKDENLEKIFSNLRSRNIGLALEVGLLPLTSECPRRDEAHTTLADLEGMLSRVQRLGGDLQYIAMDEPLAYGYRPGSEDSCGASIAAVVKQLAISLALVRKYFPDAAVGDIEPTGISPQRIADIGAFADEYRRATGSRLAFFHADVAWSRGAIKNLVTLSDLLRSRSVPFGIIYNGDYSAGSDPEWTSQARRHIADVESEQNLHPDTAVFQTWVQFPTHLLPETQPGTLTNVALTYLRGPTRLSLRRVGNEVNGALSDGSSHPIPNARVQLEAVDITGSSALQMKQIEGAVPANAVTAVVGVRIDAEGTCACSGDVSAKLGPVTYSEGGGQKIVIGLAADHSTNPYDFHTQKGKPIVFNSSGFPVRPGAHFVAAIPASVTAQSEHAGYVAVIFQARDGHEVGRKPWYFEPNTWPVGQAVSDNSGRFVEVLPNEKQQFLTTSVIHGYYEGDERNRPAAGSAQKPI